MYLSRDNWMIILEAAHDPLGEQFQPGGALFMRQQVLLLDRG